MASQYAQVTRWTINPDLKKYQSYNNNCFYDPWYCTQPSSIIATPNFYCVNDTCRQTPFMARSLSPVQNTRGQNTNETYKKMMLAKELATRLNR